MVLLNTNHINIPAGRDQQGRIMFGGAMCTCLDCVEKRRREEARDNELTKVKTTAKELREKFESDLQTLQDECPHEKYTWMDYSWAPGHFGSPVCVCDHCEKKLERTIKESNVFEGGNNANL